MPFLLSPTGGGTYPNGSPSVYALYDSVPIDYGDSPFDLIGRLDYYQAGNLLASHDTSAPAPFGEDPLGQVALVPPPTGSPNSSELIEVRAFDADGNALAFANASTTINWTQATTLRPVTDITETSAQLHASFTIFAGAHYRFRLSTTPGGPYDIGPFVGANEGVGGFAGTATGLTPGTQYYYLAETMFGPGAPENAGEVLGPSEEGTFTTLAASSATCEPATSVTQTTATLNGTTVDIPAGGSARFRRGTVAGGPYPVVVSATPSNVSGPVTGNDTSLTANTTYYYILEIRNAAQEVIATSAECTYTTLEAVVPEVDPCDPPPGLVSDCPATPTYQIGGKEYMTLLYCDGNLQIFAVYEICNGVISGPPTYYTTEGEPYTPVGTPGPCPAGSFDFEQDVFCDGGNDSHPFISRIRFDDNGDLIPEQTGTFEVDQMTPYVVVGPVVLCSSGNQVTTEQACIFDATTGLLQDTVEIIKVIAPATGDLISLKAYSLDGTVEYTFPLPATSRLGPCTPEALCTPDPALNLNAECGPWEEVDREIIALPDAQIIDDPTADVLCSPGNTWPHAAETQNPPFPIRESFRTNTFTDPNWVQFEGAHLTSGTEDTANQGWMQLTNNTPTQRGAIINATAFPTATANFVAEWTAAVRNPGPGGPGDGFGVMFLDGTKPMPTQLGGPAGAFSYTPHCGYGAPGIKAGVFEVAFDIWGGHGTDPANGPGCPSEVARSVVIRGPGDAIDPPCASTEYPCLGTTPMPFDLATHGRGNPARIRVSFITEGGQSLLSVQMAETETSPFVTVIDRQDVSGQIPLPSALRIGFVGASGGGLQEFHEIRDMVISEPGKQYWRGLSFTSDEVPDCATDVRVEASVDVEIVQDSQTVQAGNAEPEHHLRLVNIVTGETYDAAVINSAPARVDDTITLEVDTGPIPIADLPNVRLYFGTEVYDSAGAYGTIWDNLQFNVYALGCPPRQVRTIPISAPCPIPVIIVGGGGDDGGGGGATVFNSAPSIGLSNICADGAPAIRRELKNVDGTTTVDFLGADGNLITPTTWEAGPCSAETFSLEPFCFIVNASPLQVHSGYAVVRTEEASATTLYYYEIDTGITHQVADVTPVECVQDQDPTILCDDNGPFYRHVIYGSFGNIAGVRDTTLDGLPYLAVGTVRNCGATSNQLIEMCDKGETAGGGGGPAADCSNTTPVVINVPNTENAEEDDDGTMDVNDNDIEIGNEPTENDHFAGLRFAMNVPQGALVCAAWIQFTASGSTNVSPWGATITGEDQDNSAPFVDGGPGTFDITNRVKTGATVNWPNTPDWVSNQAGANQQTPSLVSIVQEIVDRPGWAANNQAGFFFEGISGYRRASSDLTGSEAPTLHVEYVVPTPGGDPVAFCRSFFMEFDSDNAATGNNFWVDPADNTWKPYTPEGDITIGHCDCATTDSLHFESLCFQDESGTQFIRIFSVDSATGEPSLIGDYSPDFAGTYAPVGAISPCGAETYTTVPTVLCDASGVQFVRSMVYRDSDGSYDSTFDRGLDGLPFAPVLPVGLCDAQTPAQETPFGQSYTGLAVVNPPALVQSVTVTVLSGAVTVTTPTGSFIAPQGSSFTWGEGTIEPMDTTGLTFAGTTAGAQFILHGELVN